MNLSLSPRQLLLALLLVVAGVGQFMGVDERVKMAFGVIAALIGIWAILTPPSVKSANVGEIVDPIRSALQRIKDGKRPEVPIGTSPQIGAVFDQMI